jgi:hypothetical protein
MKAENWVAVSSMARDRHAGIPCTGKTCNLNGGKRQSANNVGPMGKQPQCYRFVRADEGFMREYYRGERDRHLYCMQHDRRKPDEFYICTEAGEPAYTVAMPQDWRLLNAKGSASIKG